MLRLFPQGHAHLAQHRLGLAGIARHLDPHAGGPQHDEGIRLGMRQPAVPRHQMQAQRPAAVTDHDQGGRSGGEDAGLGRQQGFQLRHQRGFRAEVFFGCAPPRPLHIQAEHRHCLSPCG